MRDYIEFETTPTCEDCVQVSSSKPYLEDMKKQANRYLEMLRNRFPFIDNVGLEIRLKSCTHDFGSYIQIAIYYDIDKPEQCEAVTFIENNLPEKWKDNEVLNPCIENLVKETQKEGFGNAFC